MCKSSYKYFENKERKRAISLKGNNMHVERIRCIVIFNGRIESWTRPELDGTHISLLFLFLSLDERFVIASSITPPRYNIAPLSRLSIAEPAS